MATERITQMAYDKLSADAYVLQDYFKDSEIVEMVTRIVDGLKARIKTTCSYMFVYKNARFKVCNASTGGHLSISYDNATGVSRSLVRIIQNPARVTQDDIDNLIDMMDEAFYASIN